MKNDLFTTLAAGLLSFSAYAQCPSVPNINSTFVLSIVLGERSFEDILVIKEACPREGSSRDSPSYDLQGSLTVPGQFTSKLIGQAQVQKDVDSGSINHHIDFSIVAHEGPNTFKVRYVLDDFSNSLMGVETRKCRGTAFFEGERDIV